MYKYTYLNEAGVVASHDAARDELGLVAHRHGPRAVEGRLR